MPSTSRRGVESALPKVSRLVLSSNSAMSVKVPPISAVSRIFASRAFPVGCEGSIFILTHMAGKPGQARCGAFLLPAKSAYSRDVVKVWIDEQADQQDGVEFMAKVKSAPGRGARKASARGKSRRKTSETTRAAP